MSKACSILAAAILFLAAPAARPETVNEVKSSLNWTQGTVEGIVTYLEPNECYVEAVDRSQGIWVQGPMTGIQIGHSVPAIGTPGVALGEPAILDATVYLLNCPSPIRPFAMRDRAIGGASKGSPMSICDPTRQWVYDSKLKRWVWRAVWVPAYGANNTGLLVRTWGTVRSIYQSPVNGAKWFYLDDASGAVSDLGDTGVLVYGDADMLQGDYVAVTGVSSTEPSLDNPSRLVRVIRTRSAGDVVVLAPKPPSAQYPFSDEFDSPTLGPQWLLCPGTGTLSLTSNPGWLTITPEVTDGASQALSLVQAVVGNWDAEIKVRQVSSGGTDVSKQVFGVGLKTTTGCVPGERGHYLELDCHGAWANVRHLFITT